MEMTWLKSIFDCSVVNLELNLAVDVEIFSLRLNHSQIHLFIVALVFPPSILLLVLIGGCWLISCESVRSCRSCRGRFEVLLVDRNSLQLLLCTALTSLATHRVFFTFQRDNNTLTIFPRHSHRSAQTSYNWVRLRWASPPVCSKWRHCYTTSLNDAAITVAAAAAEPKLQLAKPG